MSVGNSAVAPRRSSLLAAWLFALPVFALLVGLGVWQVERLSWKEAMLARIDSRIHAAPTPLPPMARWAALAASDYEYTRVSAEGHFEPGREALIFRGSGHVGDGLAEPGYWVMAPFDVKGGGTILVNRGFVPLSLRVDPRRAASTNSNDETITGLLRAPETRNLFTPADDPARGDWFTRDTAAISAAMGLADPAPFSIDEDAREVAPGLPAGGATVLDIPNNHLSYAVTWFGLAATLVAVLGVFTWRRARGSD